MMNEIKTVNEMVTAKDLEEYIKAQASKLDLDFEYYGMTAHTEYTNISMRYSFDFKKSEELDNDISTIELVAGIRQCGDMTIEELTQAAEEIKAVTKLAKRVNDRMDGVWVVRK